MKRSVATRFWSGESGAIAAEFVLVFPVFVMLLLGIFEFGRALMVHNELENAVSQASRMVMINDAVSNSVLESNIRSFLDGLVGTDISVAMSRNTVDGETYRIVSISYPHQIAPLFMAPIDITMTATSRTPEGL